MAFGRRKKATAEVRPPMKAVTASRPKKRRVLPAEVKLAAMEAREAGLTAGKLAEMLGTSPSTIENWSMAYRERGASRVPSRGVRGSG